MVVCLWSVFNLVTGNAVRHLLNELWKPMFTSALLRGYTDFDVPIVTTGSFRNDNSDGNENVRKAVSL